MNVETQLRQRHLLLHAILWHGELVRFGLQSLDRLLEALGSSPGTQAGYDHVGAFQDIVSADLDKQVAVAKAWVTHWTSRSTTV